MFGALSPFVGAPLLDYIHVDVMQLTPSAFCRKWGKHFRVQHIVYL